jgi:dipeptidyl aminopeptidase/acylaminoacyl peptidase
MLENHPAIDPARVGIMGWSHGGLISLMNALITRGLQGGLRGVPVSDLIMRMGYKVSRIVISSPRRITSAKPRTKM